MTTNDPTPADLLAGALDAPQIEELRERLQQHLPDYRLLTCLGRGGMGAVFRAHHLRLDRPVAIKVLLPAPEAAQGWEARFLREAQALARLAHPGIVGVYDFGQSEDLAWIVMEYVDGANLRDLMGDGRLKPEEALAIVPQICEALQFAHDRGVVHRDVKPENVLLDEAGRVRIADFGLAKLLDAGATMQLTGTEQAMGTMRYMAPEQLERPREVDHRADIFSLGIVFYEMLTGQVPVGAVQPPSAQGCSDPRLDEVVMRSMEREPDERYQNAGDVGDRLEQLKQGQVPPSAPVRQEAGGSSASRRDRLRKASMGLAAAGLLTLIGTWNIDRFAQFQPVGIGLHVPGYETGIGLFTGVLLIGIVLVLGTVGDHREGRSSATLQAFLGPLVSVASLAAYAIGYDTDPSSAPLPLAAAGMGLVLCLMGLLQLFLREPGEETVAADWARGVEVTRRLGVAAWSGTNTFVRADWLWRLIVATLAVGGSVAVVEAWKPHDFFDAGPFASLVDSTYQVGAILGLGMVFTALGSLFLGRILGILLTLAVGVAAIVLIDFAPDPGFEIIRDPRLQFDAERWRRTLKPVEWAGWLLVLGGTLRWVVAAAKDDAEEAPDSPSI